MTPDVVAINFKGTGQKAYINRCDFDPNKHKLWTDEDDKRDAAPLPTVVPEASAPIGIAARPARTRKAK